MERTGRRTALSLGAGAAAAALAAAWVLQAGLPATAAWAAAVTALCAVWWMTEAVPLAATALVPLAVFPLTGVLTPAQTAQAYGSPLILLFLGGFLLSRGMEASGSHRRLALMLVRRIGTSGQRLVIGFTLAAALLSMWVSNTATVLMLLPVAVAALDGVTEPRLAARLLLGIAYGASIGGIATPIGSPPNLVFLKVYADTTGTALGFLDWMGYALPLVALFLPVALLWLTRGLHGTAGRPLPEPGAWRAAERRVLTVFALTALAWMTRTDPFGGWSRWLDLPGASDASVALLAAAALFLIPDGAGGRLLDWPRARSLPWDVLILFAGGIAIAEGFSHSGLSEAAGEALAGTAALPLALLILVVSLGVTLLSEIGSNTATAVLALPILAATALAAGIEPHLLMLPAVFAASCGFMLPVATPPNAIVFSTGRVPMRTMLREGLALDLIGAALITGVCLLLFR